MDTDLQTLKDAAQCVLIIDVRYRLADINEKLRLRDERDRAFNSYSLARIRLLEDGIITTQEDFSEMRRLRTEIEEAAGHQDLLVAAARLAVFLGRLATV